MTSRRLAPVLAAAILVAGPLSSRAGWDQMNGPKAAAGTTMAVHQGAFFLGNSQADAGDVFVSTDGGFEWRNTRLHDPGTNCLLSHPSGLYAGTYLGGLFRTTDLGATWTQVTGGLDPSATIDALATNGSALFATSDLGGQFRIFRSTSNGATWSALASSPATRYAALLSANQLVLAGTVSAGLYRSTDLGASWSPAPGVPGSAAVTAFAQDGGVLLAGVTVPASPSQGGIYRSTDSGASWTRISADLPTSALLTVRAIAFRGGAILAGLDANVGATGLYRSTDGGAHWTEISTSLPVPDHILSILAGGPDIIVGTPDGPYRSADEGASWSATGHGTASIEGAQALFSRDGMLFVGLDDGTIGRGIWRTVDGGDSWIPATGIPASSTAQAFVFHGNALFCGVYGAERGIFRSLDQGLSWSRFGTGISSSTILRSLHSVNGVLLAGAWEALYRSSNDGATWTAVPGISQVNAFADFDGAVYAGITDLGVERSSDNGASWTPAGTGLPANTTVEALALSGGTLYAGTWGRGVYKLVGSTWVAAGLDNNFIDDLLDADGALVAAAALENVLYVTVNGGGSWERFDQGYAAGEVYHLATDGGNLIAGSRSRGLWSRPRSELPGSASVGGTQAGRLGARAGEPWPNPVHSSSAIRYTLSRPGHVALALYDAGGREVRRVEPGDQPAGDHQISIQAASLPSGAYFYRIWTMGGAGAGDVASGRMAVIR